MTISNINGVSCVTISPIKVKYSDTTNCTTLAVTGVRDNFLDTAIVLWNLMIYTNNGWLSSDNGTINIIGTEYSEWGGDNETPFLLVASQLGLTIAS